MIFGHSDIELLRLVSWCKNLPADFSKLFSSQVSRYGKPAYQVFDPLSIDFMIRLGLINVTADGQSIRLREKGARLLRYLRYQFHRDTKYRSDDRRVEIARILLTFWRAGFDVYARSLEDMENSQVFLSSMAARQNKASNIWGGSVFWGLARFGQNVCACYYTEERRELRLNYKNERFVLNKAALRFSLREAMLFAGSDYVRLARPFRNTTSSKSSDKDAELTLPQIRETANHSIYLLPFGNDGALQLRIMCQQNYRERLAASFFRMRNMENRISAAPIGVTEADGMFDGVGPWVVAVDMDIGRIDRAQRQALAAGYDKLLLLCFESQKAGLRQLYDEEHAPLLFIPEDCLLNAFGELPLHTPQPGVYTDRRGGMIDASHLPIH